MEDGSILEAEWGNEFPVRWLDPANVKMYDSDGKEMEIPKCEICGAFKQCLIGLTAHLWICGTCIEDSAHLP
jgi:hypothetical protein